MHKLFIWTKPLVGTFNFHQNYYKYLSKGFLEIVILMSFKTKFEDKLCLKFISNSNIYKIVWKEKCRRSLSSKIFQKLRRRETSTSVFREVKTYINNFYMYFWRRSFWVSGVSALDIRGFYLSCTSIGVKSTAPNLKENIKMKN